MTITLNNERTEELSMYVFDAFCGEGSYSTLSDGNKNRVRRKVISLVAKLIDYEQHGIGMSDKAY